LHNQRLIRGRSHDRTSCSLYVNNELASMPAMAIPQQSAGSRWHSCPASLQLGLAAVFFCEAFSYTVIDPYLPAAMPTASSLALSMLFGTYSIAQLLVGLILVLVQMLPHAASMQPRHHAMLASMSFLGFMLASVPPVVFPDSLAAMFVQRALLGTCAAGIFIYCYRGIARAFEPQVALKAAACINAGESFTWWAAIALAPKLALGGHCTQSSVWGCLTIMQKQQGTRGVLQHR
jgi:hypothetical protein